MLRPRMPLTCLAMALLAASAHADEVLLVIDRPAADGWAIGTVDLTEAVRVAHVGPVQPGAIAAESTADGQSRPLAFIPDADFHCEKKIAGTVVVRLAGSERRVRLRFAAKRETKPSPLSSWALAIGRRGFPEQIVFPQSGKSVSISRWNDRLHHRQLGSFSLWDDPAPTVEHHDGGFCRVTRVRANFCQPGGKRPDSRPSAVYEWFQIAGRPTVLVRAAIRQEKAFAWGERHFLEIQFPPSVLSRWAGGEPPQQGQFVGANKSFHLSIWGAVHDGTCWLGMLAAGAVLVHDGPDGRGTYLQARGDEAWHPWEETEHRTSAWLWVGHGKAEESLRQASIQWQGETAIVATTQAVRSRIEAAEKAAERQSGESRRRAGLPLSAAIQLEAQGRLEQARAALAGQLPADWSLVEAGDLALVLRRGDQGIETLNLCDTATGRALLAPRGSPLFAITLRKRAANQDLRIAADSGWKRVAIATEGGLSTLTWEDPTEPQLAGLKVTAMARADAQAHALRWNLKVENVKAPWGVWRVIFPQLAVADLGAGAAVLYPKAAGVVQSDAWQQGLKFQGTYPSGWTTMQFLAAYAADRKSGLYVAVHDPWGSTKEIRVEARPSNPDVLFTFDHPAADMGREGSGFELAGQAVWQLLRGDWFDAAKTYRDWVRREARWYPKLTAEGRGDTPAWMRELPAWALSGGTAANCVPGVQKFSRWLDVPCGVHWYTWHQIPFDNDYPHYFPTLTDFPKGVAQLQSGGVYVMPYINGRLWDTHDRGGEDFEFTKVALPAVSKSDAGEPYTESYSSKEKDGTSVRLGVMCPTTPLWQERVKAVVGRLYGECGVKGVYIDQVAAAAPTLCFDASHGHPLGGGHWWTEGYWKMLSAIRQARPQDRMLTTECNGEPYVHCFDGYLTWHWQYDGQVAAFPAVYGGAIQMFGRSYGGGPTRDLALRMRAGEQLVFGEQLGWIHPGVVGEKDTARFFRDAVRLRWQMRRYFHAGEMARPPRLSGDVPRLRADWQWGGVMWVTADAVRTGAWAIPGEKRAVLLFAHPGDREVKAQVQFDAGECGLAGPVEVRILDPEGRGEPFQSGAAIRRDVRFAPLSVQAWEIRSP